MIIYLIGANLLNKVGFLLAISIIPGRIREPLREIQISKAKATEMPLLAVNICVPCLMTIAIFRD